MKRSLFVIGIIAMLALAACGPAATQAPAAPYVANGPALGRCSPGSAGIVRAIERYHKIQRSKPGRRAHR